ncbi:hypothetical protein V8G54_037560 [Vigna mungo]|uniref:Ubiquitin-like protease family profile domain-containing protein n=1 Tax=Vigna mungo TaxID=3915 RepID=A0AAQ3MJD4_VIGMU
MRASTLRVICEQRLPNENKYSETLSVKVFQLKLSRKLCRTPPKSPFLLLGSTYPLTASASEVVGGSLVWGIRWHLLWKGEVFWRSLLCLEVLVSLSVLCLWVFCALLKNSERRGFFAVAVVDLGIGCAVEFDVVMTLGFGVGGLEVLLDESIVGKVGEHFTNCKRTKLKELIKMFNALVHNDDLDVDVSLNRCNKKILTGNIVDSLIISGSAVVLQLWAYERLGIPAHLAFHLLNYGTEEIDLLFKRGEVHFDWYLTSEDHLHPIIHAAFNLDGVARADSCSHEEQAPEKEGDESSQLATRLRSLRNKIAAVRKELSDLRNLRNFGYVEEDGVEGEGKEDYVGEEVPGEAAGQANEAVAYETAIDEVPVDEGPAHEGPANEAPGDEAPADEECPGQGREEATHEEAVLEASEAHEERPSEAHEEGPAEAHEEVAAHAHAKGVNEEPVVEPLDYLPPFIDICDDEDDGHVQPKLVVPLRSYNGDPRTTVDFDLLYNAATRRDTPRSYVFEIMGQLLTCSTLGPRQCVDKMTIIFAATMFMYFEKILSGVIKRMVFIPFVSDGHWWCYAMKVCTYELFVIDSLEKGIKGRCRIDKSIEELAGFRKKFIRDWILDEDNVRGIETLHDLELI